MNGDTDILMNEDKDRYECQDRLTDGQRERHMDEEIGSQTDGFKDRLTDGQGKNRLKKRKTDRHMDDRWMERQTDRWMKRQTNRWIKKKTDRLTTGQINRQRLLDKDEEMD